jgi:hypothetical protein
LPHGDKRLDDAIEKLGGRERFGVQQLLDERAHADPALLLDATFEAAISLLDGLMKATPVERLNGVTASSEHEAPPPDDPVFDERSRQSIRWQLGLATEV